ncbi:MAG TPA: NAD(P)-binding domain-containing protein [Frankiaceae bacterium]|jgi:cation diffusion facilitator CzcD-associated flavoprotein CzcO|nr:NAD(P)-binding domain-containing protein [Frankiaceae bacterium]
MRATELLVIGAGPYGLALAAHARQSGIGTVTLGTPMGFWREQMPAGMFLRSGPDWHLDVAGEHTFTAFLAERRLAATDVDPIPLSSYLEYADWFTAEKGVPVDDVRVERLVRSGDRFVAELGDGESIQADAVVSAPGIAQFAVLPSWAAVLPEQRRAHTADLVTFEQLRGARCLIIGGRQSAYEWAALLCDHGAERIDIVHRHDVPRFAAADWSFVDGYIAETLRTRGWWRSLPAADRESINRRFWEVGRLTLEPWIPPRLDTRVRQYPGAEVTRAEDDGLAARVTLSSGERLDADFVVFATGYRADLQAVPYLTHLVGDGVLVKNGFPVLDDFFATTTAGLYVAGFLSTQDFGPFFGFVRGAIPTASMIVEDLLARS